MTAIFRSNNPLSLILLFISGMAFRYASFIVPGSPVTGNMDGILYQILLNGLGIYGKPFPLIYPLLVYLLIFSQALMLNSMMYTHRLLPKANYIPAYCYLLATSVFSEWWNLSSALIINTFVIWSWGRMMTLYKTQSVKNLLFNIGLVAGISSFFYFPSLGFLFLILISLSIVRAFNITEWLVCILGLLTPYYFYIAWQMMHNQWNWKSYFPALSIDMPAIRHSNWPMGGLVVLLLPFLISWLFQQENLRRTLIQVRKGWALMLLYLAFCFLVPFVNASSGIQNWLLCAMPIAAYQTNIYQSGRKAIVPNIIQFLMIIFILLMNFSYLKSA
ncbi:MAG: DUF6427 family protein [Chitinophagaceae bacterium]